MAHYREKEYELLSMYSRAEVPALILEGSSFSGKSYTVGKFVEGCDHLVVECDYLMTRRRVLQRVLRYMYERLDVDRAKFSRFESHCENPSNFVYSLKRILSKADPEQAKATFVFDRIDRMPATEQPGDLCAALSRIHEQIPQSQLSFLFTVNRADQLDLVTRSIPTVRFSPYNENQIKEILAGSISVPDSEIDESELSQFIRSYVGYLVDTYGTYFGTNMQLMVPVLRRLWPVFYEPVKQLGCVKSHVNDVLTTFLKNKALLQTDAGLVTELKETDRQLDGTQTNDTEGYDLTNRTKHVMVAAYLASYTDSKYDMLHYSRNREVRSSRKVRSRKRRQPKRDVRLLAPQAFTLERMLAILWSIYEEFDVRDGLEDDVELMNEVATLTSLKTLTKLSANDTIGGGTKWRTNIQWDVVKRFADDLGFEIENYLS